ncbi:MAG TPA: hypothetical protein VKG80_10265 [Trebonia sp.]|nr:hypothetical protein [Trebonia sp.]
MGSLVDIACSLEPLIREHAEVIEQGRMPPPLVDALHDAGVFSRASGSRSSIPSGLSASGSVAAGA